MSSKRKKKDGIRVKTVIGRIALTLGTLLVMLIVALFTVLSTIANGPSTTLRDALVLTAMQASATKWVPGLFLDQALVDQIVKDSLESNKQTVDLNNIHQNYVYETTPEGDIIIVPAETGSNGTTGPVDEWANAIDGMRYFTMSGSTYKAYVLLIRDPSRVYVGTSSDFTQNKPGMRIFDMVKKEGAIAAINGGEFEDTGGSGTGNNPMGLTYAGGVCVWNDGHRANFIGIDKNNNLVVKERMTKAEAEALGIRDGVSFQTGNVLIDHEDDKLNLYYAASNTGLAQRTAIGQRADGTIIMVVTDGRTGSSIGATHDDMINLMLSLGAVTAGMLDGGSSTMMYYEDYFLKYNLDTSSFDSYQMQGLVNRYKAFTAPRRIPTYFIVSPENEKGAES